MSDVILRSDQDSLELSDNKAPVYPSRTGLQFYTELHSNPEYITTSRDMATTNYTIALSNVSSTNRDEIFDFWDSILSRGQTLFSLIDHKKRLLFDCFWSQYQERWSKRRGGLFDISIDLESPYPWTPPLFAFYPFVDDERALYDFCLDSSSDLTLGAGGSTSSALILTEQASPAYAARNTSISWYQQKENSSVSLLAQFRTGELTNGAELDIIRISDGNNTLRLYATYSSASSSSLSSESSGQSSSSSSSSSEGLSSSSSSSSSQGLSSSSSLSSSSMSSSSSEGLSSSSSQGLSSSSSSTGQISSTSSSEGLSSSSESSLSSSEGLSSSSSSSTSASSESSSSEGLSSSSSEGLSSSSSQGSSYSSASESTSSSSSLSSSSSSSSTSFSSSSSQEGATKLTIGLEWTKSGYAAEYIHMDDVNNYADGAPAWFDICGTFDNYNNKFHLYIKRSGDSSTAWSYTSDYLYGTSSLLSTAENCLVSDTSPTNYPENVTWSSIYLLDGDTANIYTVDADKAELKFAMIIDDFISPIEFNTMRRLFHYWNQSSGELPR